MSVYQEPALIPDLDVAANLRLTATPAEPFLAWVRELGVTDLDIRDPARDIPLAVLRVLDLARALALEPDVLLLDEMTAALPANLAERVLDVVRRQSRAGRSVIFISHRFLEISALCDRATVLRDGETVGVVDIAPGAEEKIVELMLGARIEKARAAVRQTAAGRGRAAAGPPRLSVRSLQLGSKLRGRLLRSPRRRGRRRGGAGRPGAGRAVRRAVRLDPAVRRHHRGRRQPVQFRHPADAIAAGLAYVPGDRDRGAA